MGKVDELQTFRVGRGQGLIDNDVAARGQALSSQGVVGVIRCCNDDETNLGDGKKLLDAANDANVGIGLCGFVAAALEDGSQAKAGNGANHWRVKSTPS